MTFYMYIFDLARMATLRAQRLLITSVRIRLRNCKSSVILVLWRETTLPAAISFLLHVPGLRIRLEHIRQVISEKLFSRDSPDPTALRYLRIRIRRENLRPCLSYWPVPGLWIREEFNLNRPLRYLRIRIWHKNIRPFLFDKFSEKIPDPDSTWK